MAIKENLQVAAIKQAYAYLDKGPDTNLPKLMELADKMDTANAFAAQVQPRQTLLLRLGMVAIPILTLTGAYLLIRKKYRLTEEAYEKIVAEIAAR